MDELNDFINKDYNLTGAGHVYGSIIRHIERVVIIKALEDSRGNQLAAAKILGLHRNTLRHKIRKLKIDIGRFKP